MIFKKTYIASNQSKSTNIIKKHKVIKLVWKLIVTSTLIEGITKMTTNIKKNVLMMALSSLAIVELGFVYLATLIG